MHQKFIFYASKFSVGYSAGIICPYFISFFSLSICSELICICRDGYADDAE